MLLQNSWPWGLVGCQAISLLCGLFANEELTMYFIMTWNSNCVRDGRYWIWTTFALVLRKMSYLSSVVYCQVSIFVVPDYKPPLAACVMHEVLELISSEATSTERVLIVPLITRSSSYQHGMEHSTKVSPVLYGADIGATTDFTQLVITGTTKPPTSLQIRCEPILCLLEMVRVLKMPTVLLVRSGGQQQGKSSTVSDLEVILTVLFVLILVYLNLLLFIVVCNSTFLPSFDSDMSHFFW